MKKKEDEEGTAEETSTCLKIHQQFQGGRKGENDTCESDSNRMENKSKKLVSYNTWGRKTDKGSSV